MARFSIQRPRPGFEPIAAAVGRPAEARINGYSERGEERDHDRKVSEDWSDQVTLFASIPHQERMILQAGATVHGLQAGSDVVRQAEPGESLFAVHEGALDVLIDGVHGGGEKVGVMGPGAVFGELSLLTGAPRG